MRKKLFYILSSILALLMASGLLFLALVYYYQDEILVRLKEELAKNLKADVQFDELTVSLYEGFPDIKIHGKQVVVISNQTETELLRAQEIDFTFDVYKFLNNNFQIKKLKLKEGYLHMTVEEDGTKNFNIFPKKPKDAEPKEIRLFLANIEFENFGLIYDNQKTGLYCSVRADEFYASTLALNQQLSVFAEGTLNVFYLDKALKTLLNDRKLTIDTKVLYNFDQKTISVRKGYIGADRSELSLTGSVDMINYKIHKLKLKSDHMELNTILSFLPEKIAKTVKALRPEGFIKFQAEANRPDDTYKHPEIKAEVETNKSISVYLEPLNKKVENLKFKAEFNSGKNRSPETYTLNVENISATLDELPLSGQFYMKNFKNPFFKTQLSGKLQAENIFHLALKDKMRFAQGIILFDAQYEGDFKNPLARFSDFNKAELSFNQIRIGIKNFSKTIYLSNGDIKLDKQWLIVKQLNTNAGRNKVQLSTNIKHWRTFILKNGLDPYVDLSVKSPKIYFNDLKKEPTDSVDHIPDLKNILLQANASFDANAIRKGNMLDQSRLLINQLQLTPKQYPHPIVIDQLRAGIDRYDVNIESIKGHIVNSDFMLSAVIKNIIPSELKKKKGVEIGLTLDSKKLDLTKLVLEPINQEKTKKGKHKELQDFHLKCALHVPSGYFSADSILHLTRFYINDLDFKLNEYDPEFHDFNGEISLVKSDIVIRDFKLNIGKSDLKVDGALKHAFMPGERLLIDVDFYSNLLDFDELILKRDKKTKEPIEVVSIKLPDLDLTAHVNKVKYKKFTNRNFQADLSFTDNKNTKLFDISKLQTQIAGGKIGMEGELDVTDRKEMVYDGVVKLSDINLDKFLKIFENFEQDLLVDENVGGTASVNISTRLYVDEKLKPDLQKTEIITEASVRNGKLVNFRPLKIMSVFFSNKKLETVEFEDLENVLVYRDSVIYIPKMRISSNLGSFYVAGTQSIDGYMDYYIEVPIRILKIIPLKALKRIPYYLAVTIPRKLFGRPEKKQTPYEKDRFINLNAVIHIEGTAKDYEVTYETKDDIGNVAEEILDFYKDELKLNIDKLIESEEEKDKEDQKKFR